jgi:hypothetical protein
VVLDLAVGYIKISQRGVMAELLYPPDMQHGVLAVAYGAGGASVSTNTSGSWTVFICMEVDENGNRVLYFTILNAN